MDLDLYGVNAVACVWGGGKWIRCRRDGRRVAFKRNRRQSDAKRNRARVIPPFSAFEFTFRSARGRTAYEYGLFRRTGTAADTLNMGARSPVRILTAVAARERSASTADVGTT